MYLMVPQSQVKVSGDVTPKDSGDGRWYFVLDGTTTFIEGVSTGSVGINKGTAWGDLKDPYGPPKPDTSQPWDDLVWLPEWQKAKDNVETFASRSFLFPDGTLSVMRPENPWGRYGRWEFNDGTQKRWKALTDGIHLFGALTSRMGIQTDGGKKIYLEPQGTKIGLLLQHALYRDPMEFAEGTPLPHLAVLHDFAKDTDCKKTVVPTWTKRSDWANLPDPKNGSPGDLCPPLPLY
jgi:hypothetical protein